MTSQTRLHLSLRGHLKTKYIKLDPSKCQACWKCVEACPNHVLGKAILYKHRHAHVDHADACKGCKKCVCICPNKAILYKYVSHSHKSQDAQFSFQKKAISDVHLNSCSNKPTHPCNSNG
jgi:ferredoxin